MSMWPIYLIYLVCAVALAAAAASVPVARRGKRRLLWMGFASLAILLPTIAILAARPFSPDLIHATH